jgi:hypothetical protein
MGRRRVLVLGLALALAALAVTVSVPTLLSTGHLTRQIPDRLGRRAQVTINRDSAAVTAELSSSDSRTSASDARRFDPPWAALAAAATLVVAFQWLSAQRRRSRVAAPLSTRAPARAPPLVTAFASAS